MIQRKEEIYVPLDALLDTVLGTLVKIAPDYAAEVRTNGYMTRRENRFEGVDDAVFKAAYKNRDIETLQNSVLTSVVPFIRDMLFELRTQIEFGTAADPSTTSIDLIVNTHPYQLTTEEQNDLVDALDHWFGDLATVVVSRIPLELLTPNYCKQYSAMFMYDYGEWLAMHDEAFKITKLATTPLWAPALYFEREPTEEELQVFRNENIHPLKAAEMMVGMLISLRLLPVKIFSIVEP